MAWTKTAHFAFASFRKFWLVICERRVGLVSFKTNVSETAGQIHLSDNLCDVRGLAISVIMWCIKRVFNISVNKTCLKTRNAGCVLRYAKIYEDKRDLYCTKYMYTNGCMHVITLQMITNTNSYVHVIHATQYVYHIWHALHLHSPYCMNDWPEHTNGSMYAMIVCCPGLHILYISYHVHKTCQITYLKFFSLMAMFSYFGLLYLKCSCMSCHLNESTFKKHYLYHY